MAAREEELSVLRKRVAELEREVEELRRGVPASATERVPVPAAGRDGDLAAHGTAAHGLSNEDIRRYSRQLIMPALGPDAQVRFRRGRVLVIGAGGLGAPVLLYLAAAGVGTLGVVDGDRVELDNLHRQVIHSEAELGEMKADSARRAVLRLNSGVRCVAHRERFSSANAMELARQYDVLVDCTDNAPTRYLVNDAGVLAGLPVVSGSALRLEGQLTVYAYRGGPCYRCLFPNPPPAASVVNCGDGGVLGAVTGVIGSLQALEVLKLLAGFGAGESATLRQRLLVFDGSTGRFMNVKLRPRSPQCAACGDAPTIREPLAAMGEYEFFCGAASHDGPSAAVLSPSGGGGSSDSGGLLPFPRVSCRDLKALLDGCRVSSGIPPVVIDVREPVQFAICSLPGSVNVPISELRGREEEVRAMVAGRDDKNVFVVCRRGAASVRAVQTLQSLGIGATNVDGGLRSWRATVDPDFPEY